MLFIFKSALYFELQFKLRYLDNIKLIRILYMKSTSNNHSTYESSFRCMSILFWKY